ncbi:MAG: fused MFS/spermidine synthase [Actinomycetota bacterium]|nr:fused MFS/spermidine synthase [Actinomycetota bacterium]
MATTSPEIKPAAKNTLAVYLIFAVSGASALIYQVIWTRWLGLVFGNTTLSVSIVLGSFMLGLALGSWIAGRLMHSIENPMRLYAFMEMGIGIFALLFPLFARFTDYIFPLLVHSVSLNWYSLLVRAVLSIAVLLVPTTFMGTTLPLLTDFFHRSPVHTRNWRVGVLYAVNTLGAALGIIAGSFILIEAIGVLDTTRAAAVLNFIVAATGYALSRRVALEKNDTPAKGGRALAGTGKFAVAVITASGFLALASEVLWTRTMETVIGSSTYAFASIVLLYLVGIAVGSWIMSLFASRLKNLPVWLAFMLLAMGIWKVISIWLFEAIRNSMAGYSSMLVSIWTIFGHYFEVVAVLFPLALFSGACFPLATRIIDPKSEDAKGALVARAYAWNTIGALAGSFAAGFVIAPNLGYLNAIYMLAALYCLAAAAAFGFLFFAKWEVSYRTPLASSLGGIAIVFTAVSFTGAQDSNYTASLFKNHPEYTIPFQKPGLQGITTVLKNRFSTFRDKLFVNGIGMTIKTTDTKMMAHFPMMLQADPKNTLVICFGMGTTYRSALTWGKKVTVVELAKEVVEAMNYFYPDAAEVKANPNGRIVINDGRNFLKLTRQKFNVITIDPPPPIDAAGVNSLHSREFFELAAKHLKKGGIMAFWIPRPGPMTGVDSKKTVALLIGTFSRVFPYTYIHNSFDGDGLHVLGSFEPIDFSPNLITSRLAATPAALKDITEWEKVPASFYTSGWVRVPQGMIKWPSNTDDKPYLEFYFLRTLMSGQLKYHPPLFGKLDY